MRSSGQAHRVARRGNNYISPFAHDPVRSGVLPYTDSVADDLPNDEHLQTGLFDFLLQTSFTFPNKEFVLPNNVIIPSSNSYEFMKLMLDEKQYPSSSTGLETVRLGYRRYGSGSYRLLVMNCIGNFAHYNTLDIIFNIDSEEVFQSVRIYDSLGRISSRTNMSLSRNKNLPPSVSKTSLAGKYLCCLQSFLVRICFFEKQHTKQVRMLKANPEYILKKATNEECPQQYNGFDCGLFSFGILLHIANNVPVTPDVFSHSNITQFRQGLYRALVPAGGRATRSRRLRKLLPEFVYSFFPNLVGKVPSITGIGVGGLLTVTVEAVEAPQEEDDDNAPGVMVVNDMVLDPNDTTVVNDTAEDAPPDDTVVEEATDDTPAEDGVSQDVEVTEGIDDEEESDNEDEDVVLADLLADNEDDDKDDDNDGDKDDEEEDDKEEDDEDEDDDVHNEQEQDSLFMSLFDVEVQHLDFNDIQRLVDEYEILSGNRLVIRKSCNLAKTYCCVSHENCAFTAKFGPVRGSQLVVLKPTISSFYHTGPKVVITTKDGRKSKRRLKGKLDDVINVASGVKAAPLNALDVKKGAVNLQHMDVSYSQSWSVLARNKRHQQARGKESYHLIVPYLKEFERINPNSVATYEGDGLNRIIRLFVCPGTYTLFPVVWSRALLC